MSSLSKDGNSCNNHNSDDRKFQSDNDSNTMNSKKRRLDEEYTAAAAAATTSRSSNSATTEAVAAAAAVASTRTPTVYVSNLHQRVCEAHLQKLFQRFGEISRVHIIRKVLSSSGGNKGSTINNTKAGRGMTRHKQQHQSGYSYAFVEFKSIQSACTAIEKLNGVTLLGKDLVVRPANGRGQSNGENDNGTADNNEGSPEMKPLSMQNMKKQKHDVESRIDAVKRALLEKKKNR